MHDPRPTKFRRNRTAAIAVTAMLALGAGACGSDDTNNAYCDAWQNTAEAYAELRAVDVTAVGTEGLQTAVVDLDAALTELDTATKDQAGDQVQQLRDSVKKLIETVLSPDLPVDRRDEVAAASDDVRAAWDDVSTALRTECPDVTLPTS